MVLDVRATISCTLGDVISANISDDYLQLNGLIKTQGNCELDGIVTPSVGDIVTFSYTKNGITQTIPRKLRVLSSFADPYRRTTTVSLGCKLSYLSNLQEPIKWTMYDDPENASEPESVIVTMPINASSVMAKCLTELGISATQNPLTNKFSVEEFDFGSGYVQVLSDLLVSEGYFGYLNSNEVLVVRSLEEAFSTSPVLAEGDIIEISDINSGELPGESVVVSYSTVRLNQPSKEEGTDDPDEEEFLVNWDYSLDIGFPQYTTMECKNPDGNEYSFDWTYSPWSEERTEYDAWGRMKQRIRKSYNINADFGMGWFSDYCSQCSTYPQNIQNIGGGTYVTTEQTTVSYKIPAVGTKPQEGYDEVLSEETRVYEPEGKVHSGLQYNLSLGNGVFTQWNSFRGSDILTQLTKVEYEVADVKKTIYPYGSSFTGINSSSVRAYPTNKTSTTQYKSYGYTSRGQTDISKQTEAGRRFTDLKSKATAMVNDGSSSRIITGRQIGLQERPSTASKILQDAAKTSDANNGYSTSGQAEMELVFGSASAQRRIEFSMPYAPDDTFYRTLKEINSDGNPVYNFGSIRSDAAAKANAFGRIQNRLLYGNRYGMNIQTSPDKIPSTPFKPITVRANGLSALYMTNGLNWTMDQNGIIISMDGLFWQPIGGTGVFWFPTAANVVSLPVDPTPYQVSPTVLGSVANVNS